VKLGEHARSPHTARNSPKYIFVQRKRTGRRGTKLVNASGKVPRFGLQSLSLRSLAVSSFTMACRAAFQIDSFSGCGSGLGFSGIASVIILIS
jgi:hypothetical protein